MFALIQDSQIAAVVAEIPAGSALDYRLVVDGVAPTLSTTFSIAIEKPASQWTIEPTQVVREFVEFVPPMSDCRAIKKARDSLAAGVTRAQGITVTLAPYGAMTFAHDSVLDLIACSTLCDYSIRASSAAAESNTLMVLMNGSTMSVKLKDAGRIVRDFLTAYRGAYLALATKHHTAKNAANFNELEQ